MPEMNDIVKLAVDAFHGNVEKYSAEQTQETLRKALVELNNGKTTLDYRAIRDHKCDGLFTIIETILSKTVVDELSRNDFFVNMVDFRNVALGDQNLFVIEDSNLFVVAEAAEGTQGIRRQRLSGATEIKIPTRLYIVRIYEELNRVLSGMVDFNYMINKVAASFEQKLLNDIYTLWAGVTAAEIGGTDYFPAAGTFDEDALLDVIAHVEAAAGGKTATIIGTKKALRNLSGSLMSNSNAANDDLYKNGVFGFFYGSPVVVVPQRHKVGTTTFVMDDNMLTIVAGDQKMIKCVYEGDPLVLMGDPTQNADLTQEYLYADRYGLALIMDGSQNSGIGRYEIL